MNKTMIRIIISALFSLLSVFAYSREEQKPEIQPDGTYLYAQRDSCELYMDVYDPAEGSETSFEGKEKPTIIFVFGGNFADGKRDDKTYLPWFRTMTENGYRMIAIDYRLGLKEITTFGLGQANNLEDAIHIAMEDLFCATGFIVENKDMLGIDPENIVICGSSAGAVTVLQAEYEICNNACQTQNLPDGFRYKGVISFSGGILSRKGKLKYDEEPCPTLMFHGTEDNLVCYSKIRFFHLGFFGSEKIADRFKKSGYDYNILRYLGRGHEISGIMNETVREQLDFIESNVMSKSGCIVDKVIDSNFSETDG